MCHLDSSKSVYNITVSTFETSLFSFQMGSTTSNVKGLAVFGWETWVKKIGNLRLCNLWTQGKETFHFIFSSICINHPIAPLCFSQWWYLTVPSNSARFQALINSQSETIYTNKSATNYFSLFFISNCTRFRLMTVIWEL